MTRHVARHLVINDYCTAVQRFATQNSNVFSEYDRSPIFIDYVATDGNQAVEFHFGGKEA